MVWDYIAHVTLVYHKRKLVNNRVIEWPCHSKNVTTKKLSRKPSKPTAQTKELRDKEGKRALDHAGKDVFFWLLCGCFLFGGGFLCRCLLFFWGNCWDDWKLALTVGIHKNLVHFETHNFFMIFQSLQSNKPIVWSNYSDLTRPHPKWWFSKGNPLISGKSRLMKYYNLARIVNPGPGFLNGRFLLSLAVFVIS